MAVTKAMHGGKMIISPVHIEDRKKLDMRAGDTVRVWVKVQEKGKTRLQAFEGLVLARKHGSEAGATFTVRRTASGVGVERVFLLYSPVIDKIEVLRRSKVRRGKLYFIRDKVTREIKRQMRKMQMMGIETSDEMPTEETENTNPTETNESATKEITEEAK